MTTYSRLPILIISVLLVAIVTLTTGCQRKDSPDSTTAPPARVGWQVAWATQGQLALAMERSNALELAGVEARFSSYLYGAPMSEAAAGGHLDMGFVGDQPAITLLARSPDWVIASRFMTFRTAIIVPMNSPVREVKDLRGKRIGVPFGASTHRELLGALAEAGLDPNKDVTLVNIDIQEQVDIVGNARGGLWGTINAFASWDHHIAVFEEGELARVLSESNALGVIVMRQSFIDERPDSAARLLLALRLATLYYASNRDQVDRWFVEAATQAAATTFDTSILRRVASIEPNIGATTVNDVRLAITDEEMSALQAAADFAYQSGLIDSALQIRDRVDLRPLSSADDLLEDIGPAELRERQ